MAAETITTFNSLTGNRLWVTIYEANGDIQLDYGWVDVNSPRDWRSGGYLQGSIYKVKGEVKSDANGDDPTIYVTETQFTCGTNNVLRLVKGSDNYYWERN